MSSRKEKAMEKLLMEPYVSKTHIMDALGCSYEIAKQIFEKAKEIELKRIKIDPRPNQVQSHTVLKVTGNNHSFLMRQFKLRQERKEETSA